METIDIGLIAVLADVETPNFEEVTRQLLLNDNPNMDDLAACMLLIYVSVALKDTLPVVVKSYGLKKKNNVSKFARKGSKNRELAELLKETIKEKQKN